MNPTESKSALLNYVLSLLDRENPTCVFCQVPCVFSSRSIADQPDILTTDTYSCLTCNATFHVYSQDVFPSLFDAAKSKLVSYDFRFTCYELVLWYGDNPEHYLLGNKHKNIHWLKIPIFTMDFSDKNKLYSKLKTYLLFS